MGGSSIDPLRQRGPRGVYTQTNQATCPVTQCKEHCLGSAEVSVERPPERFDGSGHLSLCLRPLIAVGHNAGTINWTQSLRAIFLTCETEGSWPSTSPLRPLPPPPHSSLLHAPPPPPPHSSNASLSHTAILLSFVFCLSLSVRSISVQELATFEQCLHWVFTQRSGIVRGSVSSISNPLLC